jgi:hypothetical protein
VVVPLFYTFLDDLRGLLMRATASVFTGSRRTIADTAEPKGAPAGD